MTRALALLLVLSTTLAAQQPAFKSGVELVTVPVTVTTRDRSTPIDGLTAADFKLSENGKPQVVTTVTRERQPLSICLIVDSSGSMRLGNRRELATEAAQRMLSAMKPDDEIAIVFFGEKVELSQQWTAVRDLAGLKWEGWRPIGGTPLNDGMRAGFNLIDTARNPRRAIVLITDGFENSSRTSIADLVKTRQQSETPVYGIGVGSADIQDLAADVARVQGLGHPNAENLRRQEARAPGPPESVQPSAVLPNFDYLETIVGDSGGTVSRVLSGPEVINAAKNLIDELQYQYLVGYTPAMALDGKYRKLKVEVNRRGVHVRHRGGYLAVPFGTP